MKIIRTSLKMQSIALGLRRKGKSIGFVPTMGALHEGHLSLIRCARRENDIVIVSIFVNPKQFGPKEDYLRYPRIFSRDRELCGKERVDYLFNPDVRDMYRANHYAYVDLVKLSSIMCGVSRPGHFRGVATVVAKLFNITQPVRAYFGMKDFQQFRIVKKMAEDLDFPVDVKGLSTVREADGLAMSSRNRYLSPAERRHSIRIYKSLQQARDLLEYSKTRSVRGIKQSVRSLLKGIPKVKIDYIEIRDAGTLEPLKDKIKLPVVIAVAAKIGNTRLIDNIVVK
ncbi:MAG: pantoate--beta-alanine ligase [Elusimicrobiota bacterium]